MDSLNCKSKHDVYVYLISNLTYIHEDVIVGDYKQVMGFRQKLYISQVWHNSKTNKWAFHVSDDAFAGAPNMGEYDSLLNLLDGVADQYVRLWKLAL